MKKLDCRVEKLVLIDALDECDNEDHIREIINLLAQIHSIRWVELRLLITSRPDLPVRLGFIQIPESHRDFILHEIPMDVIGHDIGAFLRDKLSKIRDTYNSMALTRSQITMDWPSEQDVQALVQISVPLFIIAATMCRFVEDTRSEWDPEKKLSQVLNDNSIRSQKQLVRTYGPVLNQFLQDNMTQRQRNARIQQCRKIVGSIVIFSEPLSATSLSIILEESLGVV